MEDRVSKSLRTPRSASGCPGGQATSAGCGEENLARPGGSGRRAKVQRVPSRVSAREHRALYYWVYSSLNFEGEWEAHDLEYTSRAFVSGDLRDGNGLLKWFLSFHDITTPGKHRWLCV